MTKPILFIDFDGTLCHDRFWRNLPPIEREKIQNFLFKENPQMVTDWMIGKHTSEQIHKMLSENLHVDYGYIWEAFVNDCRTMSVSAVVLQKITALRDRFRIVLATDNMDCFGRFTVPALGLDTAFDSILNSYDRRISKNDESGRFFTDEADSHGVGISECLLIDNSKTTCGLFQKLGGRSHLVTEKEPLQFWLEHASISA